MTDRELIQMAQKAHGPITGKWWDMDVAALERFASLIRADERDACINIVETYRIPVGNSSAGEMACEWTYDALKEIRDEMRSRGNK